MLDTLETNHQSFVKAALALAGESFAQSWVFQQQSVRAAPLFSDDAVRPLNQ